MENENRGLSRSGAMLIAVAIVLFCAVLVLSFCFGGSKMAVDHADRFIREYAAEKFPALSSDCFSQTEYIGANTYIMRVCDPDNTDVSFTIEYTNGNINDNYNSRVASMSNTLTRLEVLLGEHLTALLTDSGADIYRAEVTFAPRVRNDIPMTIFIGVPFSENHPIYRGASITLVCEATDDMQSVAALLGKAHECLSENGYVMGEYIIYAYGSGEVKSLEISAVTGDIIESGNLCQLLDAAMSGRQNITVSSSDSEEVTVDVGEIKVRIYK